MSVITVLMSSVISARLASLTPLRILSAASLKIAPISARLACGASAAVVSGTVAGPFAARLLSAGSVLTVLTVLTMSRLLARSACSAAATPLLLAEALATEIAALLATEIAVLMSDRIACTWPSAAPENCPALTCASRPLCAMVRSFVLWLMLPSPWLLSSTGLWPKLPTGAEVALLRGAPRPEELGTMDGEAEGVSVSGTVSSGGVVDGGAGTTGGPRAPSTGGARWDLRG